MPSLDDAFITGLLALRPGPADDRVGGARPTAGLIVRMDPGPPFVKRILTGLQAQGWQKVVGMFGRFEPSDVDYLAEVDCTEQGYLTVTQADGEVLYTGAPAAGSEMPPLPPAWAELAAARRAALVYVALTPRDVTDPDALQAVVHRGLVVCAWATVEIAPGWSLEPVR